MPKTEPKKPTPASVDAAILRDAIKVLSLKQRYADICESLTAIAARLEAE